MSRVLKAGHIGESFSHREWSVLRMQDQPAAWHISTRQRQARMLLSQGRPDSVLHSVP